MWDLPERWDLAEVSLTPIFSLAPLQCRYLGTHGTCVFLLTCMVRTV